MDGSAGDEALQVAVHPGDVEGDRFDLHQAPCPLAFRGDAFSVEVLAHLFKCFDDRLDALAELDA